MPRCCEKYLGNFFVLCPLNGFAVLEIGLGKPSPIYLLLFSPSAAVTLHIFLLNGQILTVNLYT